MSALRRLMARAKEVTSEDAFLAEAAEWFCEESLADACEILTPGTHDSLVVRASTAHPEVAGRLRLGRGVGLVGTAYKSGKPLHVCSGLADHAAHKNFPGEDSEPYESAHVAPFLTGQGPGGVVHLRMGKPWKGTKAEIERLGCLIEDFSAAYLPLSRAFTAGTDDRLGQASQVARVLSESPYLEEILQLLVHLTAERFGYRVVTVRLLDENRQELVLRATQSDNRAYHKKQAIKLGESIAGRAISLMKPVVVTDVQTSPDYIGHELAVDQGLRSMVCVPLVIQGRPIGVLSCYSQDQRTFPQEEIDALETLARQASLSIENAKLQVRHTLMQEMHHRVKNNLQQVASLLRLQIQQSHYKTLEDAVSDSLARIGAIATVHDLLSRDDLDHVGIKSIAETLAHHQQLSFISPDKQINFEFRGDDVFLNTTQATQMSLVMNELIQNAIEHGFEDADSGSIHVTVEDHDPEVRVWVSNDGATVPEGFDPATDGRLGLKIIRSLVGALGGTFSITNQLGWTVCEVRFQRGVVE